MPTPSEERVVTTKVVQRPSKILCTMNLVDYLLDCNQIRSIVSQSSQPGILLSRLTLFTASLGTFLLCLNLRFVVTDADGQRAKSLAYSSVGHPKTANIVNQAGSSEETPKNLTAVRLWFK